MAKKSVNKAAPAKPEPAPKSKPFEIDIKASPDAGEGLTIRTGASDLQVVDAESHELALEMMRGAKQLKRKIEDHWSKITRSVDDLKRTLLNLKRADVAPVDAAIEMLSGKALTYENAEKARAAAAQAVIDEQARKDAARQREEEDARAEQQALEAESASGELSVRELWFVTKVSDQYPDASELLDPKFLVKTCKEAGYKDAAGQVDKLLASKKIKDAIAGRRQARAIREQAAAQREQPLETTTEKVEARLGKVSGVSTRTYYSAEVFDADKLIDAVIAGTVDRMALMPNETYLNAQAVALKEAKLFDPAFPGVRLKKRQGHAG